MSARADVKRSQGKGAGEVLSGVRQVRGADVFRPTEGNTAGVDIARHMLAPRRRRPWHAQKPFAREPGGLHRRPRQSLAGTLSGRPEAVADDECNGEVGPAHSSAEASEQGGLGCCGARGAKGRGQGESGAAVDFGFNVGLETSFAIFFGFNWDWNVASVPIETENSVRSGEDSLSFKCGFPALHILVGDLLLSGLDRTASTASSSSSTRRWMVLRWGGRIPSIRQAS